MSVATGDFSYRTRRSIVRMGISTPLAPCNCKRWDRTGQAPISGSLYHIITQCSIITFVGNSKRHEPRNTRKLHSVFNPLSAVLNIQCALQAAGPRLPTSAARAITAAQDYSPALRPGPRRKFIAARFKLQILPELVAGTPAALLILKAQSDNPAARPTSPATLTCVAGEYSRVSDP